MGSVGTAISIPSGTDLLQEAKSLKGEALKDAISRADSLGTYYREDKRQKRGYITEITQGWSNNPKKRADIESNLDIIYIIRGITKRSKQAIELSQYWSDKLYK